MKKANNRFRSGICVLTAASLLSATSCKKEANTITAQKNDAANTVSDPNAVTDRINTFYQQMKDVRDKKGTLAASFTPEEALFYTEGVLNYYAVVHNNNNFVKKIDFDVAIPVANSKITASDLSVAFWSIKERLLKEYNALSDGRNLSLLDIESKLNGTAVIFSVHASFTAGLNTTISIPVNPPLFTFTDASNHAWYIPSAGAASSTGQCTIDPVTETITSAIDNTKPGAAAALRTNGISNYNGNGPFNPPGYYTNIIAAYPTGHTASSNSSYMNLGIQGYDNQDIWNAYVFFPSTSSQTPSDPDITYKQWLTTPMMNFYLSAIPGYISSNIPAGQTFYDLDVIWTSPNTIDPAYNNPLTNGGNGNYNPYPYAARKYSFLYKVSYGTYIKNTTPPPYSLATM